MDRRGFLYLLAAGLTGAAVGRGAAGVGHPTPDHANVRGDAPVSDTAQDGVDADEEESAEL